MSIKMTLSRL